MLLCTHIHICVRACVCHGVCACACVHVSMVCVCARACIFVNVRIRILSTQYWPYTSQLTRYLTSSLLKVYFSKSCVHSARVGLEFVCTVRLFASVCPSPHPLSSIFATQLESSFTAIVSICALLPPSPLFLITFLNLCLCPLTHPFLLKKYHRHIMQN